MMLNKGQKWIFCKSLRIIKHKWTLEKISLQIINIFSIYNLKQKQMKFVLAFAMGMTIFSKIAHAGIVQAVPDAHHLVVTVTDTKGEAKDGNLKKEHDKLQVKVEEKDGGHKAHEHTPAEKQKWEDEKKAHTVNGVVDPQWKAKMKADHHKRLAEHHHRKAEHHRHVAKWEEHKKKYEEEKKAHTVNGVVDPAWVAQNKADHEKRKADHQKHVAEYEAKRKEEKQKWEDEKKAHTVNGVVDPLWEAQMKIQHHDQVKAQHKKKWEQEKAKHTVNGVVDAIWEAKALEEHHRSLGEHHKKSFEHHKDNAEWEAKKKERKQKWEQEKKAHTVNGVVDPKWEAQMKEEHHKKSAEHHQKNADWQAQKQKWQDKKKAQGHKDGGVNAEAHKNEHKDGEHKVEQHHDTKTSEVHNQVVVVKKDVTLGAPKP